MKYLSLFQVIKLHHEIIAQSGGSQGIRDVGLLESALAQPKMTFDKKELHQTLIEKASSLAFSLAVNHPFIDGNKRVAHAAMEIFLLLNGQEIRASLETQQKTFLDLASGKMSREDLAKWLQDQVISKST